MKKLEFQCKSLNRKVFRFLKTGRRLGVCGQPRQIHTPTRPPFYALPGFLPLPAAARSPLRTVPDSSARPRTRERGRSKRAGQALLRSVGKSPACGWGARGLRGGRQPSSPLPSFLSPPSFPSPLRCGRGCRFTGRNRSPVSSPRRGKGAEWHGADPAMVLRAAGLIGCCCCLLPLVLPAAPGNTGGGQREGGERWTARRLPREATQPGVASWESFGSLPGPEAGALLQSPGAELSPALAPAGPAGGLWEAFPLYPAECVSPAFAQGVRG